MRLLLDTHVFLWWQTDDASLKPSVRERIADASEVYVSAVVAWEIVIKQAIGKLEGIQGERTIESAITGLGFTELPIRVAHAERVATLPQHHKDPFDRILVAQALCEDLILVSHDRKLEPYGVPTLWT